MSSPRDPGRDFRLERLGGLRPAHLGESARIASSSAGASSRREALAAYQALIDAVFTAPGAAEWLAGLRRAMAARLAGKDEAPRAPAARDAIRKAGPGPRRP